MLKKILIILISCLLLVGCKPVDSTSEETNKFSVISLKGMSSLPLLGIDDCDLETTDSLNDISKAFDEGEIDIIFAPLVEGVTYANNSNQYKLLSIVGYSSYYVASKDEEFTKGTVGIYGSDQLESIMCNNLKTTDFNKYTFVTYDSLSALGDALTNDEVDACFVDEVDFTYLNYVYGLSLLSIDTLNSCYEYHYGYSKVPYYGMFVKDSVVENKQDYLVSFAKEIKLNITNITTNKTTFNSQLENTDLSNLGFENAEVLSAAYNDSGIDFTYASSEIDNIKNIFDIAEIEFNENMIIQ